MRQRLIVLITIVLLTAVTAHAQENLQEVAKQSLPSVVTVIAYNKAGDVISRGTGFFVSERGDLLTRRRVFPAGTHRSEVKTKDGDTYPIIIVAGDYKEADLVWAWVRVRPGSVKYLKVSSTAPQVGDQVVAISA
jgi:hypothetical protein